MYNKHYKSCSVILPDYLQKFLSEAPSVTISCVAQNPLAQNSPFNCDIQFWVGMEQQFFCRLTECNRYENALSIFSSSQPKTTYISKSAICECVSDAQLCSISKTINLGPILKDVKGPASISCNSEGGCQFSEKNLDLYFEGGVQLVCKSGECITPEMMREGPQTGFPQSNVDLMKFVFFVIISAAAGIFLWIFYAIWKHIETKKMEMFSIDEDAPSRGDFIALPEEDAEQPWIYQLPLESTSKIEFNEISYSIVPNPNAFNITGRQSLTCPISVLKNISGCVEPGEILAIMGKSGSGKTSLLNILALKAVNGQIDGNIFVNGHMINTTCMKRISGFVSQEDVLMGTLTVREALAFAAFLRLPLEMSAKDKRKRVNQTLIDLGLDHISNQLIGYPGKRGISGGEKRRLMIAQELVTKPSVLFLDEPTSGLDSFNAFSVIKTLSKVAKAHKTTIIMTIHQPRSNIWNLFDKILLLASGNLIYSGSKDLIRDHFSNIGFSCPLGYNIADYLIDVSSGIHYTSEQYLNSLKENFKSELRQTLSRTSLSHSNDNLNNMNISAEYFDRVENEKSRIEYLSQKYFESQIYYDLKTCLDNLSDDRLPRFSVDVIVSDTFYKRPFLNQISILSTRSILNLFRNPSLLFAHYVISIALAFVCGVLFWQVTDDMAGVQNRLGCLFFTCAFFAFGSMTSLDHFAIERLLFMREFSNGYYSCFSFYFCKVFFDLIPLRFFPPILFGSIVYPMVGFVGRFDCFFKFMLSLILFNLSSTALCLLIGIIFYQLSVANLISSIEILFSMLFGGFLLNKEKVVKAVAWLKYFSIFNYAYEAMIVNELSHVLLKDNTVVDVKIPGPVILRQFGFDTEGFQRDILMLVLFFNVCLVTGFWALKHFTKKSKAGF